MIEGTFCRILRREGVGSMAMVSKATCFAPRTELIAGWKGEAASDERPV